MSCATCRYRFFSNAGSIVPNSHSELRPVIHQLSLDLARGGMTEGVAQCFASDPVCVVANEWLERQNFSDSE